MATSQTIRGTNYSYCEGVINFFGAAGMVRSRGDWAINAFTDQPDCIVNPESKKPLIEEIIASDVRDGKDDQIAMLVMRPRAAVVFFLEGYVTADHLAKATEQDDIVDIPGIDFEGRQLTLRVLPQLPYSVATADCHGVII